MLRRGRRGWGRAPARASGAGVGAGEEDRDLHALPGRGDEIDRGFRILFQRLHNQRAQLAGRGPYHTLAQAHPDLMAIEREVNDSGKLKKNISVEAIREVGAFFSKAPSRSPYRVAIIDSVDDLNINSANALLKILEEPPERGLLFLVSHSPGKLLATIKS
ncbi:MAG: hypothetical protein B7Z15_20730, partial [Rhizobiales bacterium 32-66-8]